LENLDFDITYLRLKDYNNGIKFEVGLNVTNPTSFYVYSSGIKGEVKTFNHKKICFSIPSFVVPAKKTIELKGNLYIENGAYLPLGLSKHISIIIKAYVGFFKKIEEKVINIFENLLKISLIDLSFSSSYILSNTSAIIKFPIYGIYLNASGYLFEDERNYISFKTSYPVFLNSSSPLMTLVGSILDIDTMANVLGRLIISDDDYVNYKANLTFYRGSSYFTFSIVGKSRLNFGIKAFVKNFEISLTYLNPNVVIHIINKYSIEGWVEEIFLVAYDEENQEVLATGFKNETIYIAPHSETDISVIIKFNSTSTLIRYLQSDNKTSKGSYIKIKIDSMEFIVPIYIQL